MKKEMLEISVYTQEGEVVIEQPRPHCQPDIIFLSPEQIDAVISWLKEAKEELNGQSYVD